MGSTPSHSQKYPIEKEVPPSFIQQHKRKIIGAAALTAAFTAVAYRKEIDRVFRSVFSRQIFMKDLLFETCGDLSKIIQTLKNKECDQKDIKNALKQCRSKIQEIIRQTNLVRRKHIPAALSSDLLQTQKENIVYLKNGKRRSANNTSALDSF